MKLKKKTERASESESEREREREREIGRERTGRPRAICGQRYPLPCFE